MIASIGRVVVLICITGFLICITAILAIVAMRCNTVDDLGKEMEKVGEEFQKNHSA